MENQFTEVMSQRSDRELIEITTILKDDYQPDAVEAALDEIAKRGIDENTIETQESVINEINSIGDNLISSAASSWIRLLHSIIDSIVFVTIPVIFWAIMYAIGIYKLLGDGLTEMLGMSSLAVFPILYYIFMEYKYQKTVGKFLTKTKVVTLDGNSPNLSTIVTRTLLRLIPLDNFSYIFSKSGLHDRFSNTMVIKDKNNENNTLI